jgi:lysylphosphatidylglycerol synthetase-like protein (DUF2156 family)
MLRTSIISIYRILVTLGSLGLAVLYIIAASDQTHRHSTLQNTAPANIELFIFATMGAILAAAVTLAATSFWRRTSRNIHLALPIIVVILAYLYGSVLLFK